MIFLKDTLESLLTSVTEESTDEDIHAVGALLQEQGYELPDILATLSEDAITRRIAAQLAKGFLQKIYTQQQEQSVAISTALEQRKAELQALHHIHAVAIQSLQETTILRNVVEAVANVMKADVCSIYLRQNHNLLILRATIGLQPSAVGHAQLFLGEGITGWVAQHEHAAAVADIWGDERAKYLPETEEDPFHSLLSIPIPASVRYRSIERHEERRAELEQSTSLTNEYDQEMAVLGVLNIQTKECRTFTPEEIAFLEMIAGHLGLAIENARIYSQTDEQLHAKIHALTTLHQVVVAVTSNLDLQRILDTIALQALLLCQGEASLIYGRKPHQQHVYVEAQCGTSTEHYSTQAEKIAREAIQQTQHQIVLVSGKQDEHARTLLCVPLRGPRSIHGALAVYAPAGKTFEQDTIDLVTDFAHQAAFALEHAKLHRAIQQNLETKSTLLAELHHRVKNNLQTVASLLSLALRHCKSEEAAYTLRESYNRVRSIAVAHDLLSKDSIGVTTIGHVAQKVIELLEPMLQSHGALRFLTDGEIIELETREATTLAIVLNELITNAVRHGLRDRTEGLVKVTYGRQGLHVWITVSDNGHGLPPHFSITKNKGLGLSIVRTLVEADLQGQVDWHTHQGSQFTLLFCPVRPPREVTIRNKVE